MYDSGNLWERHPCCGNFLLLFPTSVQRVYAQCTHVQATYEHPDSAQWWIAYTQSVMEYWNCDSRLGLLQLDRVNIQSRELGRPSSGTICKRFTEARNTATTTGNGDYFFVLLAYSIATSPYYGTREGGVHGNTPSLDTLCV